ncbi:methyl-accepting chemotaxis protein [Hydrogenophaga palleronii]|uniref:Methyl-accepting chemotaxis protein n=1 Tax=Hydrogenophaga palleronii TaxID=65655 RepID=A0ABU1WLB1_9BURK|nr:CHASE3 domain-containing protein [Hydrogenophaga palleronii]MDR7150085.1 methyl-accepting chemotaxis protein [Hydrogenophaga palleronii]
MKWNVGTKIATGFGLALAVFVLVGMTSYRSTTQLIETSDLRQHTYEVLRHLDEALSLLKDIEIGSRSFALMGEESYLEPYLAAVNRVAPSLQELRSLIAGNPRQEQRLDALEPLVKSRIDLANQAIELRRTQGAQPALELIQTGRGKAATDQIREWIDQMRADEEERLAQRATAADDDGEHAKSIIFFGTLTALALAMLAGFLITGNIARPLQQLTAVADRITVGDLSAKLPADTRNDEVGVLAQAFERMTQSLRTMADAAAQIAAGDLRTTVKPQSAEDVLGNAFARMSEDLRAQIQGLVEGASVLGASASEIVASTSQLASSASESAAAVSETTTTVEEVRQTAQVASQKARQVSDNAQKAAQISSDGRKAAEDVTNGMNRIRQQMDAISAAMMRLSEQGQAIGQIIATVEDLATQSNLLAVNAAIEAAKAGEHGKGFGVVAQEVKSLAEQSRQATNQVRTILGDIQKATGAAVMATEEGGKAVEAGTRQTEAAGDSIQALASSVNEAAQAATQIAASSQQQLVGVGQVAGAMESIKQAAAQNVASAKQLETAASNLNELGQRLKFMVERYKV